MQNLIDDENIIVPTRTYIEEWLLLTEVQHTSKLPLMPIDISSMYVAAEIK
jgi:hypothetical protein